MPILQSETTLNNVDYAKVQTSLEQHKYKIELHKWNLDFTNTAWYSSTHITSDSTDFFDTAEMNGRLIRVGYPNIVEVWNGASWSNYTFVLPTSTPVFPRLSLVAEPANTRLWLYVMGYNGIYASRSTDYGATWSAFQFAASYPSALTDMLSLHISAYAPGRLFYTFRQSNNTCAIYHATVGTYPSHSVTQENVTLVSSPRSIAAVAVPSTNDANRALLTMAIDTPGVTTSQYLNGQVVKYIYRSGGIIGFFRENSVLSDHFEIDVFDNLTTYLYREDVRLSSINGILFMTVCSGDGSPSFHTSKYRYYVSKDGINWSTGFMIPYLAGNPKHGVDVVADSNYAYLSMAKSIYRAPLTGLLGNSTVITDITDRVMTYEFSASDMATANIVLDNGDAFFDGYDDPAQTYALVQYWGFDLAQTPQVAIHEIDSWNFIETMENDEYQRTVQVISRDHFAWMTDLVEGEWAHYWQNQMVGTDLYQDTTGTAYGGLTHTAPVSGSWKTKDNNLLLSSSNEEGVAFSTYSDTTLWNGHVSLGFRLSTSDPSEYAGIVFRAIDQSNMWWAAYKAIDDKIHLYERRDGVDTEYATSGTQGYSSVIVNNYRFLRVTFRYATITVFNSPDGKNWSTVFTFNMRGAIDIPDANALVINRPMERGSAGTIGYGFSAIDNWEPDTSEITVGDWISPDGFPDDAAYPGSRATVKSVERDYFNPNYIWYLDGTGHVKRNGGLGQLDISPSSGERTTLGTPIRMLFDKSSYQRFLVLGSKQIIANDNVYDPNAADNWYVVASAASGYAFSSDFAQDSVMRSRFFWFSVTPETAVSGTVDVYFNYTYDNFTTVGSTHLWTVTMSSLQAFPDFFGITLSYFNNAGKGYIWISTGNIRADPRTPTPFQAGLPGIYKSLDWGATFTQYIGADPFLPGNVSGVPIGGYTNYWISYWWGAPVIPYLNADGSLNSADEGLIVYFFGYVGSSNGTLHPTPSDWSVGSGIDTVNSVTNGGFGFSGPGSGSSTTSSIAQASAVSAVDGGTIYIGSEGFIPSGSVVNYFNQRSGLAGSTLIVSSHFYGPGMNGWPTNPDWLVTFGTGGYGIHIAANGTGNTFTQFGVADGVVTAFPDAMEFYPYRKQGFGYDHNIDDSIDPSDPLYDDTTNDGWDVDPFGNLFPALPPETCVSFIHMQVNSLAWPRTLEDGFKAYAGFAGITQFQFNKLYSHTVNDPSWVLIGGGTIVDDGTKITMTGTGKALWTGANLPHNYLIRGYMPLIWSKAVILNLRDVTAAAFNDPYYIVGFSSSGFPTVYKVINGTRTTVMEVFSPVDSTGFIQIACREMVFSADADNIWLLISVWINRKLVMTYVEWIKESPVVNYHWGLTTLAGSGVDFRSVEIPQMTEFVDYDTINPGDTPMSSLQTALDGRYVYYIIRWDGSLRAWKYGQVPSSHTFTTDDIFQKQRNTDHRQIANHVRMVGAYVDAEYADDSQGIMRYKQINNPYLMSELECFIEAFNSINRAKEQYDIITFSVPYRPLLEIGDRISTPDGDYIINSYNVTFSPGLSTTEYQARKYVYGA